MSLFQQEKNTKRDRSYWLTLPMLVPDINDPESRNDEVFIQRHERFLNLPRGFKEKLASVDISRKIQTIGQKYGFDLSRLANITRLIREYYFGEVRLEDFPREIEKRVGVSLLTAQEIARYIRAEIIDWDPWGEYIAKLPKLSIREIVAKHPKIADTEITSGYIELKTSEDLEDPTIKNWIHDYVLHLGQAGHSQMDRTQYLFHSENTNNLSSPDREKLGVILKSFDENTLLPIDEENGEIVFEEIENKVGIDLASVHAGQAQGLSLHEEQKPASQTPNDFIKPFPARNASQANAFSHSEADRPTVSQARAQTPPIAKISYQVTSSIPELQPRKNFTNPNSIPQPQKIANPEIDKFFNVSESPDIPPLKIHSIAEHNEPRFVPKTSPQPSPYKGEGVVRPQHRIIDPFERRFAEPRIDGNVVDLSAEE
jgi:hypothetical protein